MAVMAIPPQMAPNFLMVLLWLKEKIKRVIYITKAPTVNATTTESNIPEIMASAFPELIYNAKSPAVCPR